jgi:hypothetical protein
MMKPGPDLTVIIARTSRRPIAPDGRRSERPSHYRSAYEIVSTPSTGKPGCFDVALIRKAGFSGALVKRPVEIIRAWRNRASWRGKDGSPLHLAMQEAHALRLELDEHLKDILGRGER